MSREVILERYFTFGFNEDGVHRSADLLMAVDLVVATREHSRSCHRYSLGPRMRREKHLSCTSAQRYRCIGSRAQSTHDATAKKGGAQ